MGINEYLLLALHYLQILKVLYQHFIINLDSHHVTHIL